MNLTSYITALSVYLLKSKDILLFLLEDEAVIKLIFKALLAEVIIRLVEEVSVILVIVRTMRTIL